MANTNYTVTTGLLIGSLTGETKKYGEFNSQVIYVCVSLRQRALRDRDSPSALDLRERQELKGRAFGFLLRHTMVHPLIPVDPRAEPEARQEALYHKGLSHLERQRVSPM